MRSWIISYLILIMSIAAFAQNTTVDESFVIRKNRTLNLPIAERNYFLQTDKADFSGLVPPLKLTYDSVTFSAAVLPSITRLTIPKNTFKKPISPDIAQHMVWGSGGIRRFYDLGYQFINPIDQQRRIHLSAQAQSLGKGPTNDEFSNQNNQKVQLSILQPIQKINVQLNTIVDRTHFNFFGLPDSVYQERSNADSIISSSLFKINNSLTVENRKADLLTMGISLSHYLTKASIMQTPSENWISARISSKYQISKILNLIYKPELDIINQSAIYEHNHLITQHPIHSVFNFNQWNFSAGFNWVYVHLEDGRLTSETHTYFLPKVRISYAISPLQSINFSVDGFAKANTYFDRSTDLLYLNYAFMDWKTEVTKSQWQIDYHQTISNNHHISIYANYQNITNKAFLIASDLDSLSNIQNQLGTFSAIYDNGDLGHFQFNVAVNGRIQEKFFYDLQINFNQYFLVDLLEAYHLPVYSGQLGLTYKLNDKALINSSLNTSSGIIYYPDMAAGSIINWRINSQYQVNNKVNLLLTANNILNQSNRRYYLYPTSPFLISLGAIVRF